MDQLLNDFSPGLFFMQSFILLGLILLMRKFAWKPILDSLQDREDDISSAIEAANAAKEEMAKLTASNENLMRDARTERPSRSPYPWPWRKTARHPQIQDRAG